MSDQLMTRDEIVRRLRLVTSQRVRHRPLTVMAIAARAGLSRVAVYKAMNGIMGDVAQRVLSQVLREVDVNALVMDGANHHLGDFPNLRP
jgi:hypothetical protein